MYASIRVPWSSNPSTAESVYRAAGLVKTKGTLFLLPPPVDVLRDSFNAPPRPKTRMSAGAVALCKHFERGGASSEHGRPHPFWTLPAGSNEEKTKTAARVLEDILADAEWRNVMLLHQGVAVYEIRNARGYGMRWTLDILPKEDEEKHKIESVDKASPPQREESDHLENDWERTWEIQRTTFRGFLEPIAELDHELTTR